MFIALAGGLALIIALSRRNEQINTIAGVAIATALMPPLCTAGFGLATGNIYYFGGALFLFAINSVFIASATFVIVRFLRFPMVKYLNSINRKRIARSISVVALIIFLGSTFLFYQLYRKKQFYQNAHHFISAIKESGVGIIDEDRNNINFKTKTIQLTTFGKALSINKIKEWENKLPNFNLQHTKLIINQNYNGLNLLKHIKSLNNLIIANQNTIQSKDNEIKFLKEGLGKLYYHTIPFDEIRKEAHINYSLLKSISYNKIISTDFKKTDTTLVFNTRWTINSKQTKIEQEKFKNWLKVKLSNFNYTIEFN